MMPDHFEEQRQPLDPSSREDADREVERNEPTTRQPLSQFAFTIGSLFAAGYTKTTRFLFGTGSRRFTWLCIFVAVTLVFFYKKCGLSQCVYGEHDMIHEYVPPLPDISYHDEKSEKEVSPLQWLRENTWTQSASTMPVQRLQAMSTTRPRAAFIVLVRNSEAAAMVHSMIQIETRFNSRPTNRYDWVFFNNEEFTEEFKSAVSNCTTSRIFFEKIPAEHWSTPEWIDEDRAEIGREFLGSIGVGKAWLESYHHMCRWNSGLFALEERLQDYDWFWRVEPGVQYHCDIDYDVFRFMRDNNMAYGFNMAILDDARSFPSLWDRTREFQKHNSHMLNDEADMRWLLHENAKEDKIVRSPDFHATSASPEYNNCQFYSNFEIGSLSFFRSPQHQAYFNYLDRAGGFHYERFGDAPVHTLSVSMFLPKRRVWFFRDIGYTHGLCSQCPPHKKDVPLGPEADPDKVEKLDMMERMARGIKRWDQLSQDFRRQGAMPHLRCGCTELPLNNDFSRLVPYESKQKKPQDTCIRMWLGGVYLQKVAGWDREDEIEGGGDGYGGYAVSGLEENLLRPYGWT